MTKEEEATKEEDGCLKRNCSVEAEVEVQLADKSVSHASPNRNRNFAKSTTLIR